MKPRNAAPHLNWLNGETVLSRAEVNALVIRIRSGDLKAHARLFAANLPLVLFILKGRKSFIRSTDPESMIQEGNLGLLRAIDLFEPERGVAFSTYAAYWIRRFALYYEKMNRGVVARPGHHVERGHADVRLDKPLFDGPDSETLGSLLPAAGRASDDKFIAAETNLAIRRAAEPVARNDHEREILRLRLLAESPLTLREISARLGQTPSWILRSEERLMRRLRSALAPFSRGAESVDLASTG